MQQYIGHNSNLLSFSYLFLHISIFALIRYPIRLNPVELLEKSLSAANTQINTLLANSQHTHNTNTNPNSNPSTPRAFVVPTIPVPPLILGSINTTDINTTSANSTNIGSGSGSHTRNGPFATPPKSRRGSFSDSWDYPANKGVNLDKGVHSDSLPSSALSPLQSPSVSPMRSGKPSRRNTVTLTTPVAELVEKAIDALNQTDDEDEDTGEDINRHTHSSSSFSIPTHSITGSAPLSHDLGVTNLSIIPLSMTIATHQSSPPPTALHHRHLSSALSPVLSPVYVPPSMRSTSPSHSTLLPHSRSTSPVHSTHLPSSHTTSPTHTSPPLHGNNVFNLHSPLPPSPPITQLSPSTTNHSPPMHHTSHTPHYPPHYPAHLPSLPSMEVNTSTLYTTPHSTTHSTPHTTAHPTPHTTAHPTHPIDTHLTPTIESVSDQDLQENTLDHNITNVDDLDSNQLVTSSPSSITPTPFEGPNPTSSPTTSTQIGVPSTYSSSMQALSINTTGVSIRYSFIQKFHCIIMRNYLSCFIFLIREVEIIKF